MFRNLGRRYAVTGLSTVAAILTTLFFLQREGVDSAAQPVQNRILIPAASKPGSTPDAAPIHVSISKKPQPEFAASLRGTGRDGKLRADSNGDLVIERGIRDLFDYYLTTLGENDLAAIRQQLKELCSRELPPAAALQAMQLLDAYLQYRELSGELQQQYPVLDENNAFAVIADYFAQRDALRNQLFEPQASDAFFTADRTAEQAAMPKLQRLTGGMTSASDTATDQAEGQDSYTTYRAAAREAKDAGRPMADEDAVRTQLFGREAADRLASLDLRRNDWNARLTSYREQKQQLLEAATQAGIDPSLQLQQLQQSQFNEREILRVRALDEHAP